MVCGNGEEQSHDIERDESLLWSLLAIQFIRCDEALTIISGESNQYSSLGWRECPQLILVFFLCATSKLDFSWTESYALSIGTVPTSASSMKSLTSRFSSLA